MLLSSEPEASVVLSGDQVNVFTPARWPSSVCSSAPVLLDHIFIVASAEADAIQAPLGEYLRHDMARLCPRRMRWGV